MIWGLSYDERRAREEEWALRFAFFPVRLSDGRWIWWEPYYSRISSKCWRGGPGLAMRRYVQRVVEVPRVADTPPPPSGRSGVPVKMALRPD